MNSVRLSKIAELTGNKPSSVRKDKEITSICRDSRKALPNSAFFCLVGAVSDGHDYALAAYEHGCRVFVCERTPKGFPKRDAKLILCRGITARQALADVAAEFYGHPEREMTLIGITGTKGKTTVASMIYDVLNDNGIAAGYIGTNGVRFADYRFETVNTTPESCEIYEYLSMMLQSGVGTAVVEVSSQAMKMGRVRGLTFDTCVFTNLYPDHIGGAEHRDMEEYKACKKLLFSEHCGRYAVINADSPEADEFAAEVRDDVVRLSYAVDSNAAFRGESIELCRDKEGIGTRFVCRTVRDRVECRLNFPGRFSVMNALSAISVCGIYGVGPQAAAASLAKLHIDGRFETVSFGGVDFVIDYAHNGESLRSILSALREYSPRRLICLFGSVGGRTFTRRAEMGRVAAELADLSILTSDNPGCEDPANIIADIAAVYREGQEFVSIPDRERAIEYAAEIAEEGDVVLLAGKGHETYQQIGLLQLPFCERDILLKLQKASEIEA
ncbi:MAG: UDP-N-acetylmuramoyl-L-alanyl-D-glutamate--2,6-diaminopimelate ligase [Clostridia bacterium]|nr:UDP-N-acetylmuramoyl-L-alanyl-D-glutamate--2,6-diaminopimelate ligase [Clostridia bacterium]